MRESNGDADCLENLLKNTTIDINAYNSSGLTLLHFAALMGYDDCIYILFKYGAELDALTIDNRTVDKVASDAGFSNTAEFVKSLIAERNNFLKAVQDENCDFIISHIHSPDCKFYRTRNGLFPLHYACQIAAYKVIPELINGGFDVNQQDRFGRTPLHWAALLLDTGLFCYLVEFGADLNARSFSRKTPVCMSFPIMKEITIANYRSLCDAAFFDSIDRLDVDSCRTFINVHPHDYLLTLVDSEGNNALHHAVKDSGPANERELILQVELIRMFFTLNVDIYHANLSGLTPLELANQNSHKAIHVICSQFMQSPVDIVPAPVVAPVPEIVPFLEAVPISSDIVESDPILSPVCLDANSSFLSTDTSTPISNSMESLEPSSTVESFLLAVGLQEYCGTFSENGYILCSDLFSLSEDDFKNMGIKFGHRRRLVALLKQLDVLNRYLIQIGLESHEEDLKKLGFDTVCSLLGVHADYADKMGLTEEEMHSWLDNLDTLKHPTIPDFSDTDSSEPILLSVLSEERTKLVMAQSGVENVSYLLYFDITARDELGLRFGEAVGLSYVVSQIKERRCIERRPSSKE